MQKSLSLERRPNGFALIKREENGVLQEIILSESEMLFLPRIFQQSIAEIESEKSHLGNKLSAKAAIEVCGAQLNLTTDRKSVLLSFIDKFSNETTFVLPRNIAQPLGERFFARTSEMEASTSTK